MPPLQVFEANEIIDKTTRARIEQAYGKIPIRFEANERQTDARVKFMARGAGYSVFLTGDEAVLQLRKGKSGDVGAEERENPMADRSVESVALRMKLSGSNPPRRVSGIGKLQTTSDYFIGNNPAAWLREVSNYSKVKYESVYPGIDMVWYGNQQLLEHDFLIAPGADPSRIKLSFSGIEKISIDGEGALVLRSGNVVAQGVASIAETAPGLFSADLSGQGYAAALVLRVRQDGSKVFEPVARFDFEENRFVAVPIDLSNETEQVFLLLSGTGIRNHSGLANLRAKIGSENAEVTFAGAEGILPGVDQVNLRLLPSLRGRGEVSVELSVDGRAANTVRVKIK
jgi:uncharacterized protein (TIGR03437 family)